MVACSPVVLRYCGDAVHRSDSVLVEPVHALMQVSAENGPTALGWGNVTVGYGSYDLALFYTVRKLVDRCYGWLTMLWALWWWRRASSAADLLLMLLTRIVRAHQGAAARALHTVTGQIPRGADFGRGRWRGVHSPDARRRLQDYAVGSSF